MAMSTNIAQTKDFLRELWALRDVPRPAFRLLGWNEPEWEPPADAAVDPLLRDHLARAVRTALAAATIPDDGVPLLNSYIHIGVHASAFGCPVIREPGQEPKVKPIITSADQADALPDPHPTEETRRALEYQRILAGYVRPGWQVTHTDLQGPTDTASLVWDYTDLLVSGMTDPDRVHAVLRRITDFIIEFEREQLAENPALNLNHNPCIWLPENFGISASEDLVSVTGPAWYREFGLPYNNRLAEEFNGLFMHACGRFTDALDVVLEHDRLRGVNCNLAEVDLEKMLDGLAGKTVIVPRLSLGKGEPLLRRYVAYLHDRNLDRVHHYFILDNDGVYTLNEALALLRELGIAPKDAA